MQMLAMEDLLSELVGERQGFLPPGFRFHPTDEELITFYLASKVLNDSFCGIQIAEVDLNRCEPWELPDVAKLGEREWYLFSLRDRKYPTGLRTNRATGAGYWKATGKDRQVYSALSGALLGMKKTLVFYKGRAPRGEKTKWVMHEYRLDGDFSYRHTCKEEWVICRIFNKTEAIKDAFFQGQGFLLESSSPPNSTSLPPTSMEYESHGPRNPFQENDPKSLQLSPLISINGWFQFQPPFSPMTPLGINTSEETNKNKDANTTDPSQLTLFESLLAHQDWSLKEQSTIFKQYKAEANFTHFQIPDDNLSWALDEVDNRQNPYLCPLAFQMDCNVLGITAATGSDITAHEISTSVAFNRAAFQMMLDTPLRLPAESWPLDS